MHLTCGFRILFEVKKSEVLEQVEGLGLEFELRCGIWVIGWSSGFKVKIPGLESRPRVWELGLMLVANWFWQWVKGLEFWL